MTNILVVLNGTFTIHIHEANTTPRLQLTDNSGHSRHMIVHSFPCHGAGWTP